MTFTHKPSAQAGNTGNSAASTMPAQHVRYKVGGVQTVDYSDTNDPGLGNSLTLKLTGIIDPATTSNEYVAGQGQKVVALELTITNNSSDYYRSGGTDTVIATGSDGQSYDPVGDPVSSCNHYLIGDGYELSPGGSLSGCIVIMLPKHVSVTKISFTPTGNDETMQSGIQAKSAAEWTVQ